MLSYFVIFKSSGC